MTNEITLVTKLQEMELAPEQSKTLLDSFGDLFVEAHKLVAQSKGIKVTREDQKEEMAEAKAIRIKLMKIRTQAEKTKKAIKEPYMRGAQAAQDIYNDIRDITEPEEERLEEQEKFAIRAEQKRMDERLSGRVTKLGRYVDDLTVYTLREMPEDVFERLLGDCKAVYDAKVEAAKKAEEERVEKEKAEIERQKKIELENEKLRKEAADRAIVDKIKQEEVEKKIKRAEEAKEIAERALKEKEKAEKDRLDAIAKKEAEELARKQEEERKALFAPDKVKLVEFAAMIDKIQYPAVASRDAQLIIQEAEVILTKASEYIREKSKGL